MKIAHICPYFQPKLGYQETFLAKSQIKQGHNVVVITSDLYFPFPDYEKTIKPILGERLVGIGKFKEEGISVVRLSRKFDFWNRVYLKNLEKTLEEIKPDLVIVHATCTFLAWQAAKAKTKIGYKLICDDHMHLSIILQNKLIKKIIYKIFSLLFMSTIKKQTDKFVAITEETKQIMQDYYGVPKSRTEVIELGVDTELFRKDLTAREEIRKKYKIDLEDIVFIYAGKIIFDKGPKILLEALAEKIRENKKIKIMFIGNGSQDYLKEMHTIINENGIENQIIWVEMVANKDLYKYYSAADIGVWPKQESMTMQEASSCELPIIIKDSASMRERIKDKNGLTYKESNVSDLTKKIEDMLQSDYKEMGKRGRELIIREFSWDKIAQEFIKI